MTEYLLNTLDKLKGISVPTSFEAFFGMLNTPIAIVVIGLLVVFAWEGYRMFKAIIYVISALAFGIVGDVFITPLIPEALWAAFPENIDIDAHAAVAIVCALFAVLLTRLSLKFIVFLGGGATGFIVGYLYVVGLIKGFFPTLGFLDHRNVKIAIAAACAFVVALLFLLLFKYIYIIASSLGGMAAASLVVGKTVLPNEGKFVMICFIGIGVAVGLFAAAHQFIEEQKSYEIDF